MYIIYDCKHYYIMYAHFPESQLSTEPYMNTQLD